MISEKLKKAIAEIPDFPKAGISFKDITPVLADAQLSHELLTAMSDWARPLKPDFIAGIESRGFMMGFALARELGVGFIPIRKPGKLPRPVLSEDYELEYGSATLQIHKEDLKKGNRVIIHDDLLATGGTAQAAAKLCERSEAQVVGMHFLVELSFLNGRKRLPKHPALTAMTTY